MWKILAELLRNYFRISAVKSHDTTKLTPTTQDPRNVELIWDQCWRSTINYGRKGLPIQALSALDLALWDALGKLRKEPVYAMLGGKTKARLPTVR